MLVVATWELAARVILAVGLGSIVGLERQARNKIAGVRTHALVALGAALFTIVGAFGFGFRGDPTRVAAQVVTGIGFIGAGAIVRAGVTVTGVTTAATLWVAASFGVVSALGMYALSMSAGVTTLFVMLVLPRLAARALGRRPMYLEMRYAIGHGTLAPLFETVGAAGGIVQHMAMTETDSGVRSVRLEVVGVDAETFDLAVSRLTERPEVAHIEVEPQDR